MSGTETSQFEKLKRGNRMGRGDGLTGSDALACLEGTSCRDKSNCEILCRNPGKLSFT